MHQCVKHESQIFFAMCQRVRRTESVKQPPYLNNDRSNVEDNLPGFVSLVLLFLVNDSRNCAAKSFGLRTAQATPESGTVKEWPSKWQPHDRTRCPPFDRARHRVRVQLPRRTRKTESQCFRVIDSARARAVLRLAQLAQSPCSLCLIDN